MRDPGMLERSAAFYRKVAHLPEARLADWRRWEDQVLRYDVDAEAIPEGLGTEGLRAWLLDLSARLDARARDLRAARTRAHRPQADLLDEGAVRAAHDAMVHDADGLACSPVCAWCSDHDYERTAGK